MQWHACPCDKMGHCKRVKEKGEMVMMPSCYLKNKSREKRGGMGVLNK
jgi:hypothetical protein